MGGRRSTLLYLQRLQQMDLLLEQHWLLVQQLELVQMGLVVGMDQLVQHRYHLLKQDLPDEHRKHGCL